MSANRGGGNRKKVGRPANLIRQKHFRQLGDGKWYCNYCTQNYGMKTSSGNLTKHMKQSHSDKLTAEELANQEYENVASCPEGMTNMGYSPGHPHVSASPMPHVSSAPPLHQQNTFQPAPSFQQNSPSPVESQSSNSPFFIGSGEQVETFTPISTSQSFNYQPQIVVTTYDQQDAQLQNHFHNNFNASISPQSFTSKIEPIDTSYMDIEQSIVLSDILKSASSYENLSSSGQFSISNITQPTGFQKQSEFVTQFSLTSEPNHDGAAGAIVSRKRKHEISAGSVFELKEIVEDLIEGGRGKEEIQKYVEEAILDNPILFNAFLRKPHYTIDTLQMIDSRLGQISLSLLGDGLIGQRKDAIKQILYEQCNQQWDPCLFQVYLFPFRLRNQLYCTVELGFQNSSSQRRSCILDCIEIPLEAHKEFIGGSVVNLLKNFGVQNKLSEVSIRGTFSEVAHATRENLETDLIVFLREQIKVKDQRLKIKLSNSRKDYSTRIKEYFEVPGIDHSDETFRLQMKLANYDSLLVEIKELFPKAIEKAKMEIANDEQLQFNQTLYLENNLGLPYRSSVEVKQAKSFVESVTNRLQRIQIAMKRLKQAASPIESSLLRIGKDSKYHIYYLPTNTREKLNLLRLVPLLSYENELQHVNRLLKTLVECINRYYSEAFTSEFSVDELTEYFNLVEIDSKDLAPAEYDLFSLSFGDWDAIYKQGLRIFNRYFDTCEFLANISSNWIETGTTSYYVNELKTMNQHTPSDIPFDNFKKLAFLKAWKTFEETFKSK